MGRPAARASDRARRINPDGSLPPNPPRTLVSFASQTVHIGGVPAAASPEASTTTVLIEGEPALRVGDVVTIAGKQYRIQFGSSTVLIGD